MCDIMPSKVRGLHVFRAGAVPASVSRQASSSDGSEQAEKVPGAREDAIGGFSARLVCFS
jgi:hypothetical protein